MASARCTFFLEDGPYVIRPTGAGCSLWNCNRERDRAVVIVQHTDEVISRGQRCKGVVGGEISIA